MPPVTGIIDAVQAPWFEAGLIGVLPFNSERDCVSQTHSAHFKSSLARLTASPWVKPWALLDRATSAVSARRNQYFRHLGAMLVAVTLSACGGGSNTEKINGISVPPLPNSTENQASIAGVDTNNNGIRDDVDRTLATEFGQNAAAHQVAVTFARTLQAALASPTAATTEQHIALIRCERDLQKLADFQKITLATLEAPIRRRAYSNAFAGVVLSSRGCP